MNLRHSKPFRNGTSLAVILPADWVRGNSIGPGDEVEIAYDGVVRIRPLKPKVIPVEEGSSA